MQKVVKEKYMPVRVTRAMYDRLRRVAKRNNQKIGWVVRAAIDSYIPQESEVRNEKAV